MNGGLEEGLGSVQWELLGCLAMAWLCVYGIIAKGLHSSGKIIWFTALFPYFVMAILLCRALTLEGAADGLLYYITPDWSKLWSGQTWIDGATQIFFAYSVGMGALPALGSYNKFHHNCYKYVNFISDSNVAEVIHFMIMCMCQRRLQHIKNNCNSLEIYQFIIFYLSGTRSSLASSTP